MVLNVIFGGKTKRITPIIKPFYRRKTG